MIKSMRFFLAILCLCATGASAQEKSEATAFYKLDFVVKEVEGGKVVNSRTYTSMLPVGKNRGSIRTGNRVPVQTGKVEGGFSYMDVGVNIDFSNLNEFGDRLSLDLTADISSHVASETAGLPPVIRQNRWQAAIVVPMRRATTVFTSDDPSTKRQIQLELTATPVTATPAK